MRVFLEPFERRLALRDRRVVIFGLALDTSVGGIAVALVTLIAALALYHLMADPDEADPWAVCAAALAPGED